MKRPSSIAFGMQVFAASVAFSTATIAQEVTLQSPDGTVNMTGTFVDFRDESYIISTEHGEMRVAVGRVDCFGDACPRLEHEASIEVPQEIKEAIRQSEHLCDGQTAILRRCDEGNWKHRKAGNWPPVEQSRREFPPAIPATRTRHATVPQHEMFTEIRSVSCLNP